LLLMVHQHLGAIRVQGGAVAVGAAEKIE
jgi:hypothetical protein